MRGRMKYKNGTCFDTEITSFLCFTHEVFVSCTFRHTKSVYFCRRPLYRPVQYPSVDYVSNIDENTSINYLLKAFAIPVHST